MPFSPNGHRLLIKPADSEAVTPGGIHLPDNAKKKATRGTVVAVGNFFDDGYYEEQHPFDEGDQVLFKPYCGDEIEVGGETYLIVESKDVLGFFEE